MIRNFTPHPICLAPEGPQSAPETWIEVASEGRATIGGGSAAPAPVAGSPIPLVARLAPGPIQGLPESVGPEDWIAVSFPVASQVPVERARLEAEIARVVGHDHALASERAGALAPLWARVAVLERVVGLGTGPTDEAIRWTADDATASRCTAQQVGFVRAVTRLVQP